MNSRNFVKNIAILYALLGLVANYSTIFAQEIKIDFLKGSWYDIVNKAQEENKYIFVDVYADYCPPCKVMENEVFIDKKVSLFYNEHFINYKVNISNRDQAYFQDLHSVKELPAFMYFTSDGTSVMKKETGCKEIQEFMDMGMDVLNTNRATFQKVYATPEYARLTELKRLYERGTRYPKLLNEYARLLKKHRYPYNIIVNEYLRGQARSPRTPDNRDFIYNFAINLENMAIDFFVKDIVYFKEKYGGERINEKVKTSIYNSVLTAIRERDYELFKRAEETIAKASLADSDKFRFEMQSLFYQGTEDWNTYAKVSYKFLNKKNVTDPTLLNDVARKFHQYINNKKYLKSALGWAKKSIKIENEYYNNETYAALLYKLGKTSKAIKAAQDAIYIARMRGNIDYQPTLHMLDRMKSTHERQKSISQF